MSGDGSATTALGRVPGYVRKRIERWLARRRLGRYFRRHPGHRALSKRAAAAGVCEADRVLFLCWGNVCRSPLAARYLRDRLDDAGIDGTAVESAGLGEREGRESPPAAIEVAARFGVDLADHRSRRASDALVEASDVVFVMDYYNYHLLGKHHSEATGKTFFLGAFADDGGSPEIVDPHGKGRERFDSVYSTVVDAVEAVADVAGGSSGTEGCLDEG